MSNNIQWIASLSQKNPLLALVVTLLIGIAFTAASMTLLYNDGKNKDSTCETKIEKLNIKISELEGQVITLNNQLVDDREQFYKQQKYKDSVSIAKLEELNNSLQSKIKQQEGVNRIQENNINTRSKTIRLNDAIKKENDKKINSLKNELKK